MFQCFSLLEDCILQTFRDLGPWRFCPGYLLKGFCCLSCSIWIVRSPSLLTHAPGLRFCGSCPPATAELISPQERVKKMKGCVSEAVRLWGLWKPSLIYIRALLESFPTGIFGMLWEASTTFFMHNVAILES